MAAEAASQLDLARLIAAAAEPLPDTDDPALAEAADRFADARVAMTRRLVSLAAGQLRAALPRQRRARFLPYLREGQHPQARATLMTERLERFIGASITTIPNAGTTFRGRRGQSSSMRGSGSTKRTR